MNGGTGIDLNDVTLDGGFFDITLEDKLGNATRVGLDSLSYHLSEDVDSVELIVYLESEEKYKYNAS